MNDDLDIKSLVADLRVVRFAMNCQIPRLCALSTRL